jgi:hypothetical protein
MRMSANGCVWGTPFDHSSSDAPLHLHTDTRVSFPPSSPRLSLVFSPPLPGLSSIFPCCYKLCFPHSPPLYTHRRDMFRRHSAGEVDETNRGGAGGAAGGNQGGAHAPLETPKSMQDESDSPRGARGVKFTFDAAETKAATGGGAGAHGDRYD